MKIFDEYFLALQKFPVSDVTEHTYRGDLQTLLEKIIKIAKLEILIQHEPKRNLGFGAPDFKVKSKGEAIIGYIENKKLTDELPRTVKSDQLIKYQSLSNNILLTNYIEWYWIKDGEVIAKVKLCELADIEDRVSGRLSLSNSKAVYQLIINFLSQFPKGIAKPKPLAEALAIRARFLRDFLYLQLERQENEHQEGRLYGLYDTFKQNIFQDLTKKEFSDAFSQTLVYGLFLSKLNAKEKIIDLYNAKQFILPAFGLISELVDFLDELDKEHYNDARWIVEEILSVMNTLNLPSIVRNLSYERFKTTNLFDEENISYKDPYIYFYEHFLGAYDKSLRKAKGVYYTPPQVVNFIVRSINNVIKNTFQIEDGYADRNKVTVLDFATGTGSFLVEILELIFEELPEKSGKKNLLIKDHILKNFYGFEYMIAPYAVANLKLSQFIKEQGYELEADDRFQIYLTNTLEPIDPQIRMPLLPTLTKEAKAAQRVKDNPILVITGNPPYFGNSRNPSEKIIPTELKNGKIVNRKVKTWIGDKIETYKYVDGKHFGEKKHWLGDDYVKFMRFAEWKMEQVKEGIVGIITNHRFISNPTFRGMRQSLMSTFDQIYILDLHGSNKPKEFAPDGGPDENVFDIEQGVAISFFIKKPGIEKKVFRSETFGKRVDKYEFCINNDIDTVEWKEVQPTAPFYLFQDSNESDSSKYEEGWYLNEIFIKDVNGVQTSRDHFSIDFEKSSLKSRLIDFRNSDISDSRIIEQYKLKDTRGWKLTKARAAFMKIGDWEKNIQLINYRPFDARYIYYDRTLIDWPRMEIMKNMLQENVAICVGRAGQNVEASIDWNLAFISDRIIDLNLFYRGGEVLFPLYIYEEQTLFKKKKKADIKIENLTAKFRKFINAKFRTPTPESIIAYIYAILYAPSYRKKYRPLLNIDFPKILFPKDYETFLAISNLGSDLISIHLQKNVPSKRDFPVGNFSGVGENKVLRREFTLSRDTDSVGKLYINESQYFDQVPKPVYEFFIGGYQVLDKYLKDRKDKVLNLSEVETVENIIRILQATRHKMLEIDKLTASWI